MSEFLRRGRHSPAAQQQGATRLLVVGDVHGNWNSGDVAALKSLKPAVVLLLGDFDTFEARKLLGQIHSAMNKGGLFHRVILGNHDAWPRDPMRPDKSVDVVQAQLEFLGETHIGYSSSLVPGHPVSIVGGRPCSSGGSELGECKTLLRKRYKVRNMQDSAQRVAQLIAKQSDSHSVVLMGHNGPTGLGMNSCDLCGKDWDNKQGDNGDPDLEEALHIASKDGVNVPVVLFGHNHHKLSATSGGGQRNMVYIHEQKGTVYLNCAVVPRHCRSLVTYKQGIMGKLVGKLGMGKQITHHFTIVDMLNGDVQCAQEVFMRVPIFLGFSACTVHAVQELVRTLPTSDDDLLVREYYKAHSATWSGPVATKRKHKDKN